MALKKDKEKVIDPVWSEDRIREFLSLQPPAGENADFHKLLKAYQSMRPEDFVLFIKFFTDADGKLNAKSQNGQTVKEIIAQHRHGTEYISALEKHGA